MRGGDTSGVRGCPAEGGGGLSAGAHFSVWVWSVEAN